MHTMQNQGAVCCNDLDLLGTTVPTLESALEAAIIEVADRVGYLISRDELRRKVGEEGMTVASGAYRNHVYTIAGHMLAEKVLEGEKAVKRVAFPATQMSSNVVYPGP